MNIRFQFAPVAALLLGFLLLAAVPAKPAHAQTETATVSAPEIVVSGTGEVMVKPDIAYISLGVVSRNKLPSVASNANATQTTAVIKSLKKAGIADADIRTEGYSLVADYDYANNKRTFKGYAVRNTVSVTVREIGKAGKVLDAALLAGANNVGGVSFDIADATKAEEEALQKAVADATRQAKLAAKAAGIENIRLRQLTVGASYEGGGAGYERNYGGFAANLAPTPIQIGRQRVFATVTARYTIIGGTPAITP
ncbi:MAG: SIMPL domain-containing protein [Armatimonadetes bacterium]|nr:SIMPL domain-containing protein [Armatimonadota bacterium]